MTKPPVLIVCQGCRGSGYVSQPRRAVLRFQPEIDTLPTADTCRHCHGSGRLPINGWPLAEKPGAQEPDTDA